MNQIYAHGGDVVVVLVHLFIIFSFFTLSQLAVRSEGRYLRPADHGLLTYQNSTTPPTRDNVPQQQQMSSFFNGEKPVQSNLPLPEAKNITTTSGGGADVVNDDWWKRRIRSRDKAKGSRDHLKEVLLVASLVCGVAGVIFLAVSGFIFLSRWRKDRSVPQSTLALTGDAGGAATNKP